MKGFSFHRVYVIICERCNENIVERADEMDIRTREDAEEYAWAHLAQHVNDGSANPEVMMES